MKHQFSYQTVIGRLHICDDDNALTAVLFSGKHDAEVSEEETPVIREAFRQIEEYLRGERRTFDLVLRPEGTPFQHRVWEALKAIPYGETQSYKQVAQAVGNPKACRAVGMANNRNPLPIVIPCHRVIGTDGKPVGYAGGLEVKEHLLKLETDHR